MSFAELEVITDREAALDAFVAKMQELFPGWEATEGDLLLWFAEFVADLYPDLANLASEMSALAFGQFGEQVLGVPPIAAASATADTTWTLTDTDGHTIPVGTQIQIADGDDLYAFVVTQEVQVLAGSSATTAGEVPISAILPGEAANDLSADPTLIDALSFVDSIALVGTTSGGLEAEDPDDYLDRLKDEFTTLSRVLILPADVAVAARRVAGVERALVIDGYFPGVNEVQSLVATGGSAGTFTLTYSGQTTAAIAYNANAAAVQSALEALSNIAPGDVSVTGGPLPTTPVLVEFTGTLEKTNVAQMTVTDSVTGGDAVVTTTTAGVVPASNQEKTVTVFAIDDTGAAVSAAVQDAIEAELASRREVGFLFYTDDPTFTEVDVDYVITSYAGVDETGLIASCDSVLADYLSPAGWGLSPTDSDPGVWIDTPKVYLNEVIALLDRVEGVDRVVSVALGEAGGATSAADLTLDGPAPLPILGTADGSVS